MIGNEKERDNRQMKEHPHTDFVFSGGSARKMKERGADLARQEKKRGDDQRAKGGILLFLFHQIKL